MPKTKRFETPDAKADRLLQEKLYGALRTQGTTQRDLAVRLRMSEVTLGRRLKHPGDLKLDELRRLARALNIPADAMRDLII